MQVSCNECDYLNSIDSLFCEHCGWRINITPKVNSSSNVNRFVSETKSTHPNGNPFIAPLQGGNPFAQAPYPHSANPFSHEANFAHAKDHEKATPATTTSNPFATSAELYSTISASNPFEMPQKQSSYSDKPKLSSTSKSLDSAPPKYVNPFDNVSSTPTHDSLSSLSIQSNQRVSVVSSPLGVSISLQASPSEPQASAAGAPAFQLGNVTTPNAKEQSSFDDFSSKSSLSSETQSLTIAATEIPADPVPIRCSLANKSFAQELVEKLAAFKIPELLAPLQNQDVMSLQVFRSNSVRDMKNNN
jgi:hypothetical protein